MSNIKTAVTTTRNLENTTTGIDISVPDFLWSNKNQKQRISYHVLIVRKIKTTRSDNKKLVVHSTIDKQFNDFLKFRKDLDKKYSGSYVPEIPKPNRGLIKITESTDRKTLRSNQINLDNFMKWCASTLKISSSPLLKDFLGIKETSIDPDSTENEDKPNAEKEQNMKLKQRAEIQEKLFGEEDDNSETDIFEEEEKENDDLVLPSKQKEETDSDEEIFGDKSANSNKVGLFDHIELEGQVKKDNSDLVIYNDDVTPTSTLDDVTSASNADDAILDANDGDLADVTAKLKSYASERKYVSNNSDDVNAEDDVTANVPAIDVETMLEGDLSNYINQNNQDDAELDLGF